jgi:4-hydroxybenzoate polyprenyltransferase
VSGPRPQHPSPRPDALSAVSLVLLVLVAVLLLVPLLGGPLPSPYLIVVLLIARLIVQFLRARHDPNLKRPAAWAFDVLLIGLLLWTAANRPAG